MKNGWWWSEAWSSRSGPFMSFWQFDIHECVVVTLRYKDDKDVKPQNSGLPQILRESTQTRILRTGLESDMSSGELFILLEVTRLICVHKHGGSKEPNYLVHVFSTWLVVWNIFYDFPYIGNVIIPTDFNSIIFQRGRLTTNQAPIFAMSCKWTSWFWICSPRQGSVLRLGRLRGRIPWNGFHGPEHGDFFHSYLLGKL